MNVKVLGTGCAGCKLVHKNVSDAVAEMGLEATIEKEEDLMKIMEYNVMSLPAMVVDGKVLFSGKKPSKEEIKSILQSI